MARSLRPGPSTRRPLIAALPIATFEILSPTTADNIGMLQVVDVQRDERYVQSISRNARILIVQDVAPTPDGPLGTLAVQFFAPQEMSQRAQNPDWRVVLDMPGDIDLANRAHRVPTFFSPQEMAQRAQSPDWTLALNLPGSIDITNLERRATQWWPSQEQWSARSPNIRYLADLVTQPSFWSPPNPERYAQYVAAVEQHQKLNTSRWLLDLSTPVVTPDLPPRKARSFTAVERAFASGADVLVGDDVPNPSIDPFQMRPPTTRWFATPVELHRKASDSRWLLDFSRAFISYDLPKRTIPVFWAAQEQHQPRALGRWLLDNYTIPPSAGEADISALIGARHPTMLSSTERGAAYSLPMPIGDNVSQPDLGVDPIFHFPRATFVPPLETSRRAVDPRQRFAIDLLQPESEPVLMQGMRMQLHFDPPYSFFRGVNPRVITIGADVANQLIEFQFAQRPSRRPVFVPAQEQLQRITSTEWQIQFAPEGFLLDGAILGYMRTPAFHTVTQVATYSVSMPIGPDVSNPPAGGNEAQLETLARRGWDFTPAVQEMHKRAVDARIQITLAADFYVVGGMDKQDYLPHTKAYDALGRMQPLKMAYLFPPPPLVNDNPELTTLIGGRRNTFFSSVEHSFEASVAVQVGADVANPPVGPEDLVLASLHKLSIYFRAPDEYTKRVEFPRLLLNAPTYEFIGGVGSPWNFIPAQEYFKRVRTDLLVGGPVFVQAQLPLRAARVPFFEPVITRPIDYGRDFRVTQLDLPTPAPLAQFQFQPKRDKFVPSAQTQLEHAFSDGWILVIDKRGGTVPCYRRLWLLGQLELHDFDVKPSAYTHQARLTVETNLGATNLNDIGRLRIIELPEPYL